jgi:hypothetical protein
LPASSSIPVRAEAARLAIDDAADAARREDFVAPGRLDDRGVRLASVRFGEL